MNLREKAINIIKIKDPLEHAANEKFRFLTSNSLTAFSLKFGENLKKTLFSIPKKCHFGIGPNLAKFHNIPRINILIDKK